MACTLGGSFNRRRKLATEERFLAGALRHLLLGEAELARQPVIAAGLLHGGQVQALQVFHDGHLHGLLVGNRAHHRGDGLMVEHARSFAAALAGNDLIASACYRPHHDGLQHAYGLNGSGQLVERGRVERNGARLVRVAVEVVEQNLPQHLAGAIARRCGVRSGRNRGRSMRHVPRRKQGLQAAAKNFALFGHGKSLAYSKSQLAEGIFVRGERGHKAPL